MKDSDEKYMQMALDLAACGIGSVEPNPAVGCVIVKAGKVIGKGFHEQFGAPHAEVNAIADCAANGFDTKDATMYVSLEPCCHTGKTPPCTDAIIKAGIGKVVIATLDPFEQVAGKGVELLKRAGIEVQTGPCEKRARLLNAPFIKFATEKLPWVIVKWAQSLDGKLACSPASGQRWISNEKSRLDAHKLRRRTQAILVGVNTIIEDDPLLTPRPAQGKKPLRIVLDSSLKTPLDCKLLNDLSSPNLIVTTQEAVSAKFEAVNAITQKNAQILATEPVDGRCDLKALLKDLGKNGIQQLLVEGGEKVLTAFITAGLADEARIYITPEKLGDRGTVDISEPMKYLTKPSNLYHPTTKHFDKDTRITGLIKNQKSK